ncbi:PucR family transcriptional regulator ligand-binding domain-containing protein [Streptomyces sp. NPDC048659]|uniref:PucR family transcriptional regulator n=1 Tax=Streptomyces sp. NPDC048659 TaxID=3155489 RepID=UPI003419E1AA
MRVRVRDLLAMPELGLTLLTPEGEHTGLARELRWVYATDLLEPAAFLTGGELVLTSEGWYRTPADCETFAASLAEGGAAALVAGDLLLGEVPPALVEACGRHGIPVLAAPPQISYGALSRTVIDRINRERGLELADVLGRHRRLVAALVEGADLGGLVAMLAAELHTDCWALSSAGRLLAGPAESFPAAARAHLAATAQRADRLPTLIDGHWALPIGRRSAGGGLLVVRGEPSDPEAAEQTAELLALGGARRDERRRTEQRFHADLVELIEQAAPPATLATRLRTAGLDPTGPFLVLTALTRGALRPWDLAADLAESVLDDSPDTRTVVAGGEHGLTLLISPGPACDGTSRDETSGGDTSRDATTFNNTTVDNAAFDDTAFAALLDERLARFEPVAEGGRIAFGLGSTAPDAGGLARALEESRHAARLAALRPTRLALVTARALDSHLLLLAGVPAEIRASYRRRLLGPLQEYDTEHGADLVRTLTIFLEHNGAWRTTATALHIHVSTLHYRIGRIQHLTGRDLATAHDRVDLYLACAIDTP